MIKDKMMKAYILILFFLLAWGCKDFLEETSQNKVHPSTLDDLEQMLLGDAYLENYTTYNCTWLLTDEAKSNGVTMEWAQETHDKLKWLFTWDEQMFTEAGIGYEAAYYSALYESILGCNLVLDYLDEMTGNNRLRENLRGEALTLRAWYYLQLVNLFGIAYNQGDPSTNLGVPLKLNSTVTGEFFTRNTVAEVYAQIEEDLLEGNRLLTEYDYHRNYFRIGTLAAKAILSRVYLYMENWDKALAYADSVLMEKDELLDLNTLDWTGEYWNMWGDVYSSNTSDEIIWCRNVPENFGSISMSQQPFTISDELEGMYEGGTVSDYVNRKSQDLRSVIYFCWQSSGTDGNKKWRSGVRKITQFNGERHGIRTAELYLNRAEAYARKYLKERNESYRGAALADLNELRQCRFNKAFTYKVLNITDGEELLEFCLAERRRELCGETNHRWCDLRRLGVMVKHELIEGETKIEYTKDMSHYVLPLQEEVMLWNPDLVQNK